MDGAERLQVGPGRPWTKLGELCNSKEKRDDAFRDRKACVSLNLVPVT